MKASTKKSVRKGKQTTTKGSRQTIILGLTRDQAASLVSICHAIASQPIKSVSVGVMENIGLLLFFEHFLQSDGRHPQMDALWEKEGQPEVSIRFNKRAA